MFLATARPSWRLFLGTFTVFVSIAVVVFLFKLIAARRQFIALQKQGLSMPPYHPVAGHLLESAKLMAGLPADAHGHYLPGRMMRAIPELGSIFYIDNWPFSPPILVVASPEGASQIAQVRVLPKFHAVRHFTHPLTGNFGLLTMEGSAWKAWRAIFNPGFSADHLTSLIPSIMEDMHVFCDILLDHARTGDLFSLENLTTNLTLDIIGRVTLDTEFNAQRTTNELTSRLLLQISWLSYGFENNLWQRYHPFRPLVHWYNNRHMNRYLTRELHKKSALSNEADLAEKPNSNKSVIDLALHKYQVTQGSAKEAVIGMDATFKAVAMSQIKEFMFAGHDTTSSTLDYIFYLLSMEPGTLHLLRAEHTHIFGADISRTDSLITEKPHLLNQLPYTLAIIKETLRLFPPASSLRQGEPGFFVTDNSGRQYPTQGCLVWCVHHAIQRNSAYWPRPDDFLPERWLVSKGHPLFPVEGTWRAFELGPRHCIGQQLALIELKLVLVMTARKFNVSPAYAEWDRLNPKKGPKTVGGERAYQVVRGGAHPSDGFPCKVSVANGED